ncbi:MAG: hypothetical protein ACREV5_16770 [Steroidobacter sp.]
MTAIYFDRKVDDDTRRREIFEGSLYVYSPNEHSFALCEIARELLSEGFSGRDPRLAQHELDVKEFAAILAQVKPRFIHHPDCKRIIPKMLEHIGCDLGLTYFDVPRMRSATSDAYLTSGIAYAFHPHRDTWYSAPMCQINWWLPLFEVEEANAMAFHQRCWNRSVFNDSETFNYQDWNANSRFNAAQHVGVDLRKQPHAQEAIDLEPRNVVLTPPGGMLLFSAAQMHSTIPNTTGVTRYSIDFRVVHESDLAARRGARNVDSKCTGSAINDYLRGVDLSHIRDDLQQQYIPGHPQPIER